MNVVVIKLKKLLQGLFPDAANITGKSKESRLGGEKDGSGYFVSNRLSAAFVP